MRLLLLPKKCYFQRPAHQKFLLGRVIQPDGASDLLPKAACQRLEWCLFHTPINYRCHR